MPRETLQSDDAHLESLAALAGGVAHEFNNVLTIVLGYGGLIPDLAGEPERLRQTMAHIMAAAQRGADVVYQLQLFARTQECPRTPHDLHQLIRDSVVHTSRNWPATIEVQLLLAAGPLILPLNAAQIILALQHLLQNAREALLLECGRITLRTSLHPEASPHQLCLSIEDTGTGMDEVARGHACEPFFTRHRNQGVRGLGLSVVYGVVTAHGGRIEVDTTPAGTGARIRLWLPLHPVENKAPLEHEDSDAPDFLARQRDAMAAARDYAGIVSS